MKYVLSLCVIVVAILTMGCQDSNMTGPVTTAHNQLLKPSPTIGHLEFKGDVTPGSIGIVNGPTFHVIGLVSYTYVISGAGENQFYEFSINTQARLVPTGGADIEGTVNNQWAYQIATASKQGVILVQKDYYVPELGTKFHVIFAIAENNSFSVQSMWLDQLGTAQIGA